MSRGNKSVQEGFTIIELLLAMSFVAVLLLTIAVTVIQIGNMHSKGMTLRNVDQAARVITSDVRRIVGQSQPFALESNLTYQRHPSSSVGDPDGGRLCTGDYTYVWNFGKSLSNPINKYETGDDQIRFARVRDNGGAYCADPTKNIKNSDATELLAANSRDLAVQSFTVELLTPDDNSGQAMYFFRMQVGTNNQEAIDRKPDPVLTINASCKPPSEESGLQNFCAVNQFDFTAVAGNKGGV